MPKNQLFKQNRLFALAKEGKRLPPILIAIMLLFVFILVGQLIGSIPYVLLLFLQLLPGGSTPMGAALHLLLLFFLTLPPTGVLLWLWIRLYEKRGLRTLGFEKFAWGWKFVRGFLIGMGLLFVVTGVMAVFGFLKTQNQGTPYHLTALIPVLLVLPGWIVQGSLEEIVYRGWLMPVLSVRSNPVLGVTVSSLLFAALHLLNPNIGVLSVLNLILAGLLFALLALWEGSLWGACGLHAAWNWAQGSLLGLQVSGNELIGPKFFQFAENGPDLLTGGAFGPEGGLITTLVYIVACALLTLLIRRKKVDQNDVKQPGT